MNDTFSGIPGLAKLISAAEQLVSLHEYHLKHAQSDMPGNDFYSTWLMIIVARAKQGLAELEHAKNERHNTNP